MHFDHFASWQLGILYPSLSLVLLSILLQVFTLKRRLSLFCLILASLGLGAFVMLLDPFLHPWDEQFHALVAKHMIDQPLRPELYANPVLPFLQTSWTMGEVWLHKQPLFLWQMALSMKLFGVTEWAARIPSVLMYSIAVAMVYRIGKLSVNERVGYYAALLFASSNYALELVAGNKVNDHNDVAFLFYVTASFWGWVEYQSSGKKKWLMLIGAFAGMAVLVKWLVGLLVLGGWGLVILSSKQRFEFSKWRNIGLSMAVSALVILPWQIYILLQYPVVAVYEYKLNSRHVFEVVEGHAGDIWFHFNALFDLYGRGDLVPWIILGSLFFLYIKLINNNYRIAFLSAIIAIYAFFSIAATKMTSYCLVVSPLIYLAIACLLDFVIEKLPQKVQWQRYISKALSATMLAAFFWLSMNLEGIEKYHTTIDPYYGYLRDKALKRTVLVKQIGQHLENDDYVVFNCPENYNIPAMFYNNITAYDFIPDSTQYKDLIQNGIKIAVIQEDSLPDYLLENEEVIKIPAR